MGSIKQRKGGTWEVKYELPRGLDGKRRQKTVTVVGGKTEAKLELARRVASAAENDFSDPAKMTVQALLLRWLDSNSDLAISTRRRYRGFITFNIVPVIGKVPLAKLSSLHIEAALKTWRSMERQDRKGGKYATLSGRTVRHIWDTFRAACNYGVRMRLLSANPCSYVMPPKKPKSNVKSATVDQAVELLEGLAATILLVPTIVAFGTGLRRGELLALQRSDVDIANRTIKVRQSLTVTDAGETIVKDTKTGRGRQVAIPAFVLPWLEKHLEDPLWPSSAFLFPNPYTGGVWQPDKFSSAFYYRVRALDLPTVSVHSLRHSFTTVMQKAKVPVKVTSTALGHSTSVLTQDVYTHVVNDDQIEAASAFDGIVTSAIKRRRKGTSETDRGGFGEVSSL